MSEPLQYRVEDGLAIVTLDAPPVNSLGQAMRAALLAALEQALADNAVSAIVLASSQKVFCGGADISEFGTPKAGAEPDLPGLLNTIEAAGKPVIAAINGIALGGGLELALACDYRFAAPGAKVGLPEVNLGLIPGAGGCISIARRMGRQRCARLCLSGQRIKASQALEWGLVDAIED